MSTLLRPWRPYLRWMLASLAAVLLLVGAFNVFVDPLGVFASPRVRGINAIKPYLDHHRELSRWTAAKQLCAEVGIFGNSRAEIGFDPQGPAFAAQGLGAFNHAIPGSGAILAYRQLNWLKAAGCMPKTIILGGEFFDFLGGTPAFALPVAASDPAPRVDARLLAETVFSLTGLRDSLLTVAQQRSPYAATITDHGFNPLANYIPEVEQGGHYVLFRQRAEENLRNWRRKPPRIEPREGGISSDQQQVEAILAQAAAAGSTVHLVIYPYHAEIRMMLERAGLGELFADWKKLIVASAARSPQVKVWDFSAISAETREAIPPRGDHHTQLAYYWEAGHFKKALGDKALARMLGGRGDFGVELYPDTVDAWLAADRARVEALFATPSPLLREVDSVVPR
jgi:type II secretory pathway component PulM